MLTSLRTVSVDDHVSFYLIFNSPSCLGKKGERVPRFKRHHELDLTSYGVIGAIVGDGVGCAKDDGAVAGVIAEVDVLVGFVEMFEVVAADVAARGEADQDYAGFSVASDLVVEDLGVLSPIAENRAIGWVVVFGIDFVVGDGE